MYGNLPPGVTQRMIDDAYGPEPPEQPRCSRCGRYVPVLPERAEPWEDGQQCDGQTVVYVVPNPSWAIEEFGLEPGSTYEERLAPCGHAADHEPHLEIHAAGVRLFRRCACGHVTEEVQ